MSDETTTQTVYVVRKEANYDSAPVVYGVRSTERHAELLKAFLIDEGFDPHGIMIEAVDLSGVDRPVVLGWRVEIGSSFYRQSADLQIAVERTVLPNDEPWIPQGKDVVVSVDLSDEQSGVFTALVSPCSRERAIREVLRWWKSYGRALWAVRRVRFDQRHEDAEELKGFRPVCADATEEAPPEHDAVTTSELGPALSVAMQALVEAARKRLSETSAQS